MITEIMYDPAGSNSEHSKWIEIYNAAEKSIELKKDSFGLIDEKDLKPGADGVHYLNCHKIDRDLVIEPDNFALLITDEDNFKKDYPGSSFSLAKSAFTFVSTQKYLRLSFDKCATFPSQLDFSNFSGGKDNGLTLEKIDFKASDNFENWQESYVLSGTPGVKSSKKPAPKFYSDKIYLNEILPAPGKNNNEYIELYNPTDEKQALENYILRDASKTGRYVFPANKEINAKSFLTVYKGADFSFALNNSGLETVSLFDPNEKLISSVTYSGAKTDLSYNFDGKSWRWSRFLTPDKENRFNNLPTVKVKNPKKAYINTYVIFSAGGSDKDHDKLKYTWDFGDGHKSYKRETRHKFEKAKKYKVALKIFDGSEEKIKNFKIEIKKFPKKKVRITEISANPRGKDSDFEYIVLENQTDKKINLKNWAVATGNKKLYNHPVLADLIIGPKAKLKITRDFSKFTLNNKKSEIRLNYPDGKLAFKTKYDKKTSTVAENEIFALVNNAWQWILPKNQLAIATPKNNPPSTKPATIDADNNLLLDNLGKYSESASHQIQKKSKISSLSYATSVNIPKNLYTPGEIVLGASTKKQTEDFYMLKIFKNLLLALNSLLSRFLYNYF